MNIAAVSPLASYAAGDLLLEHYRQAAGFTVPPRAHVHEDVQVGLNVNVGGRYRYRGSVHPIGVGEIAFVTSGEAHHPGDGSPAPPGAQYRTLYVAPKRWSAALADVAGARTGEVGFRQPVFRDPVLGTQLLALHEAGERGEQSLAVDVAVEAVLARLASRLLASSPARRTVCPRHLQRVRAYLHEYAAEGISLATLAALGELSAPHLCRSFSATFGLPPHRYQLAIRISRAKRLLASGISPGQTAVMLGFADQPHLTRCFKGLVGVTPGRFVAGMSRLR